MSFSIQKLIAEALKREEFEKRSWWATDFGRCLSGVYYRRIGEKMTNPPDERALRIYAAGEIFHEWLEELLQKKERVIARELRVVNQVYDISGKVDLIIERDGKQILFDIKTVNSQAFKIRKKSQLLQAQDHHRLQVNAYLWMLRPVYPNLEGRLFYISKDDLQVEEVPVAYSEKTVEEIKKTLDYLNHCFKNKIPPKSIEPVVFDPIKKKYVINWAARFCEYHELCAGKDWLEKATKKVIELNKKSTK